MVLMFVIIHHLYSRLYSPHSHWVRPDQTDKYKGLMSINMHAYIKRVERDIPFIYLFKTFATKDKLTGDKQ